MDAESVATGDAHAEHTAADRSSTQQSEDPNSMVADMLRRTSLRTIRRERPYRHPLMQ